MRDLDREEVHGCPDVLVGRLGVWRYFRHRHTSYDGCPCSNSSADAHGGTDHYCGAHLNRRRVDDCSTDDLGRTDHHRRTDDHGRTDHHRRTHHQRWHNNYDWTYSIGMARRHWGESLWASQRR